MLTIIFTQFDAGSRRTAKSNVICKCLNNLEKSKTASPDADFVLEGTVMNYNLTFDIAWKVMKDILVKSCQIQGVAVHVIKSLQ